MKANRIILSASLVRTVGLVLAGCAALFLFRGCTEAPSDDMLAAVQYLPLAVVVPKGQELQKAEEYAKAHPGHFAYLAVMSRPLSPYGGKAGLVARDLAWSELQRGMTVVYLAQRDGMVGGMGAGLLIEKEGEGWLFKSWGAEKAKPTLLKRAAYAGVVVVAFVGEEMPLHDTGTLTTKPAGGSQDAMASHVPAAK